MALPAVFLRDENIVVNSIDDMAPRLGADAQALRAAAVGRWCLPIMAWQGFIAARDTFEFHDVTADLGLPRVWHWVAVLIGIIGSAIAALAMALRRTDQAQSRRAHEHRRRSACSASSLLLVLIFIARADRGRARGRRACSATPRSTAGRRR